MTVNGKPEEKEQIEEEYFENSINRVVTLNSGTVIITFDGDITEASRAERDFIFFLTDAAKNFEF